MAYHQRQRCRGESSSEHTRIDIHEVLQTVCSNITLDKSEVARANEDVRTVIQEHLIPALKNDPVFSYLYQEIVYAGSFYNGLKVEKPNEYDLSFVLKLPVAISFLELSTKDTPPGHVRILHFKSALEKEEALQLHENYEVKQLMLNWCNHDGALLQNECRQWFYGLVDKYLQRNARFLELKLEEVTGETRSIELKSQGPAATLTIGDLSIDLVPVFEFKSYVIPPPRFRKLGDLFKKPKRLYHHDPGLFHAPRYVYYHKKKVAKKEYPWYAVPKPFLDRNDVWRASFVRHEKELLKDVGCIKPAVRLIKKLRDSRKWVNLHSYYINTVALWEIHNNNIHCHDSDLVDCFFTLLNSLLHYISNNSLKSFWDAELNLLQNMSDSTRINLANELKRLVNKFEYYKTNNPRAIGAIIEHGAE